MDKDDLIKSWVRILGDLPEEWAKHLPPSESTGRCIIIPVAMTFRLEDYRRALDIDPLLTKITFFKSLLTNFDSR